MRCQPAPNSGLHGPTADAPLHVARKLGDVDLADPKSSIRCTVAECGRAVPVHGGRTRLERWSSLRCCWSNFSSSLSSLIASMPSALHVYQPITSAHKVVAVVIYTLNDILTSKSKFFNIPYGCHVHFNLKRKRKYQRQEGEILRRNVHTRDILHSTRESTETSASILLSVHQQR
mmetsp:Transcript_86056/g.229652  ORF Transcript_86056/g.229652 Transcript_86056/m.229652 type:complete len:175 (+) Transcript_86056:67-591(+)